mmetsp:Transcript_35933/g.114225  ORF Transcript_35933/g.114225 Transcript_35933/m.114225 type:complete len:308 (+) Transcript_35933:18-941(+)
MQLCAHWGSIQPAVHTPGLRMLWRPSDRTVRRAPSALCKIWDLCRRGRSRLRPLRRDLALGLRLLVRLIVAAEVTRRGFERVEGHRPGEARDRVLEGLARLLAEQRVVVRAPNAQEAPAAPQPHVLAVGHPLLLQAVFALLHALRKDLHAAVGDDLDRPVKPLVAIVEVHDLRGAFGPHVGTEPPRQEDSIRIKLGCPVVVLVVAKADDLLPHSVKDLGVQGGVVLTPKLALQGAAHDAGLDAHGRPGGQHGALVADDVPSVAVEDAHTLCQLRPDQRNLVAPGQHQREAVERGFRALVRLRGSLQL